MGQLATVLALSALLALVPGPASLAQERAGVVTTAEGPVSVVRASVATPTPLKFKDAVFVQDRVATGDRALARLLLGGKAIITVREHSSVTITEVPGKSIVDLGTGRMALSVARERMKTGETIDIRTANAVASVRGTVVVAEVAGAGSASVASAFTVLRGSVDVTRIDATRATVGAPVAVGALQRVDVDGTQVRPLPAAQTVPPVTLQQINADFQVKLFPPSSVSAAGIVAAAQMRHAVAMTQQIVAATAGTAAASPVQTAVATQGSGESASTPASPAGSSQQDKDTSSPGAGGGRKNDAGEPGQRRGQADRDDGRDRGRTAKDRGAKDVTVNLITAPPVSKPRVTPVVTPSTTALQGATRVIRQILQETVPVSQLSAATVSAAGGGSTVSAAVTGGGGNAANAGTGQGQGVGAGQGSGAAQGGGGGQSGGGGQGGNAGGNGGQGGSGGQGGGSGQNVGQGQAQGQGQGQGQGNGNQGNNNAGGNGRGRARR